MEYKKDKRTKNLTLRDIHVGDWVQAWRSIPKEYTPPMKVSSIHYDGTVYLVSDDEGHCTPFEANIKDIDALPITPDLLKGFGFSVKMYSSGDGKIRYNDHYISFLRKYYEVEEDFSGMIYEVETDQNTILHFWYMHEYIAYVEDILEIKIEWKGIEK